MVDNQSHRDWNVFIAEQADGLPDTIFVNLKILFAEIAGKPPFAVSHRSVQHHEIDVYGNPVRPRALFLRCRNILRFEPARETCQE